MTIFSALKCWHRFRSNREISNQLARVNGAAAAAAAPQQRQQRHAVEILYLDYQFISEHSPCARSFARWLAHWLAHSFNFEPQEHTRSVTVSTSAFDVSLYWCVVSAKYQCSNIKYSTIWWILSYMHYSFSDTKSSIMNISK